jgi:LysM repeat protein
VEERYMKKTFFFSFIMLIIFSAALIATADVLKIESEEYTVQKGDTLWDISDGQWEDNFLWPKIWQFNPQVKNPDLIYPGDKLRIPSKEELMRMLREREQKEIPFVEKPGIPPIEKLIKALPKKPMLDKDLYIGSGWIAGEYPSVGKIVSSQDTRTIVGKTDTVYVKIPAGTSSGEKFYVIRKIKKIIHPHTDELLGYLIHIPGVIDIVDTTENLTQAVVTASYEEIRVGDGLFPYRELDPPAIPDAPRFPDINGYIVESYNEAEVMSVGEVVYLDKGEDDGLQVGDMFSVLLTKPVKRPIATLLVFDARPELSKAVVVKSSQEVTRGDMWGKK